MPCRMPGNLPEWLSGAVRDAGRRAQQQQEQHQHKEHQHQEEQQQEHQQEEQEEARGRPQGATIACLNWCSCCTDDN